jgi:hypothetical protein
MKNWNESLPRAGFFCFSGGKSRFKIQDSRFKIEEGRRKKED